MSASGPTPDRQLSQFCRRASWRHARLCVPRGRATENAQSVRYHQHCSCPVVHQRPRVDRRRNRISVRQDMYVGLVELCCPMNHIFIRETGMVGDNPGHAKSRGWATRVQVTTYPVREREEARRIFGTFTRTRCHVEGIGGLGEKVHACVVRLSHYSTPHIRDWRSDEPAPSHWNPSDTRSCRRKRRR